MGQCTEKYEFNLLADARVEETTKRCEREAFANGLCHYHLDDPNKDVGPFEEELSRIRHNKITDYCQWVFPRTFIEFPKEVADIYFVGAKFYGDISFAQTQFQGCTSFDKALFLGEVQFGTKPEQERSPTNFQKELSLIHTKFYNKVDFSRCIFHHNPVFKRTVFKRETRFEAAMFMGRQPTPEVVFDEVDFCGHTIFDSRWDSREGRLVFRRCNMEGLQISSLPFRSRHVDVRINRPKKWYKSRRFPLPRERIIDEEKIANDPVRLVDTYRFLENHFHERSDYSLASQFFIGQMKAQRMDSNYGWGPSLLNWLYEKTSSYGEALIRPLVTFGLVALVCTFALLFTGTKVRRVSDSGKPYVAEVQYLPTLESESWDEFWTDFQTTLFGNFGSSTINRSHELAPSAGSFGQVIVIIETGLNAILLSLLVIAARRKFTPKKPTGS